MNEIVVCCAECGRDEGGGISLKACMSCKDVKYCGAACQKKHWPTHKKACKKRGLMFIMFFLTIHDLKIKRGMQHIRIID